eukprot:3941862-Rhodomonas_salina.1
MGTTTLHICYTMSVTVVPGIGTGHRELYGAKPPLLPRYASPGSITRRARLNTYSMGLAPYGRAIQTARSSIHQRCTPGFISAPHQRLIAAWHAVDSSTQQVYTLIHFGTVHRCAAQTWTVWKRERRSEVGRRTCKAAPHPSSVPHIAYKKRSTLHELSTAHRVANA